MSKVTDMARAEADAAEAEPVEQTDDIEAVPRQAESESEPRRADGADSASFEKQLRAFERENERHERELRKIMGGDFDTFEPCPGCGSVGHRPVVAMRYDADTEQCPTCVGHGYLMTGAVRDDKVVRECVACQGNGFRFKPPPAPPAQPQPYAQPVYDPNQPYPASQGSSAPQPPNGGGWAPGYEPQPQGLPQPFPGR